MEERRRRRWRRRRICWSCNPCNPLHWKKRPGSRGGATYGTMRLARARVSHATVRKEEGGTQHVCR